MAQVIDQARTSTNVNPAKLTCHTEKIAEYRIRYSRGLETGVTDYTVYTDSLRDQSPSIVDARTSVKTFFFTSVIRAKNSKLKRFGCVPSRRRWKCEFVLRVINGAENIPPNLKQCFLCAGLDG